MRDYLKPLTGYVASFVFLHFVLLINRIQNAVSPPPALGLVAFHMVCLCAYGKLKIQSYLTKFQTPILYHVCPDFAQTYCFGFQCLSFMVLFTYFIQLKVVLIITHDSLIYFDFGKQRYFIHFSTLQSTVCTILLSIAMTQYIMYSLYIG